MFRSKALGRNDGWNLKGKAKVVGSYAMRALLGHLRKERNAKTFVDTFLSFDICCSSDKIQVLGGCQY